jgi:hypothetical protein
VLADEAGAARVAALVEGQYRAHDQTGRSGSWSVRASAVRAGSEAAICCSAR